MNAVLSALEADGCSISKGFETFNGEEDLYLSRLKMFAENDIPSKINDAYFRCDLNKLRSYSCSLTHILFNLGLMSLYYLNESLLASVCSGRLSELDSLMPQFMAAHSRYVNIVLSAS